MKSSNKISKALETIITELGYTDKYDFDKIATNLLNLKNPDLSDIFCDSASDLLRLDNVKVFSFCKCHFQPVLYTIDIVIDQYCKCVKLSKVKKIIQAIALKPSYQEVLTKEIASGLMTALDSKMVKVKIIGTHTCMSENRKIVTAEIARNEGYEAEFIKNEVEKKRKDIEGLFDAMFGDKKKADD